MKVMFVAAVVLAPRMATADLAGLQLDWPPGRRFARKRTLRW